MGRHETFAHGMPLADDLLASTMLERLHGVDPIFAAIEARVEAEAACDAWNAAHGDGPKTKQLLAEDSELNDGSFAAYKRMVSTVPTTMAGRLALLDHLRIEMDWQGFSENHPPESDSDFWPEFFGALRGALGGATRPVPEADLIFAAIEETKQLHAAREAALDLPYPPGSLHPGPEAAAAGDAFHGHVADVLLKTVPRTAAGCAALARYCCEVYAANGWTLDENENGDAHLRVLDLIARSPLLPGLQCHAAAEPMSPVAEGEPVVPEARDTPHPDAALIELGRRYAEAREAYDDAEDQAETIVEAVEVPEPAAIFPSQEDHALGLYPFAVQRRDGQFWYCVHERDIGPKSLRRRPLLIGGRESYCPKA